MADIYIGTICGRLTHDPEIKQLEVADNSDRPVSVCNFCVAANNRRKKQTDGTTEYLPTYENIAWYGTPATFARLSLRAGDRVTVIGSIVDEEWEVNGEIKRRRKMKAITVFPGTFNKDERFDDTGVPFGDEVI